MGLEKLVYPCKFIIYGFFGHDGFLTNKMCVKKWLLHNYQVLQSTMGFQITDEDFVRLGPPIWKCRQTMAA